MPTTHAQPACRVKGPCTLHRAVSGLCKAAQLHAVGGTRSVARCTSHGEMEGIGRAGPDPALLCVWAIPSHAAVEAMLRDDRLPGMQLVDIGLYRSFGDEVL